jgi:hypothetical protein
MPHQRQVSENTTALTFVFQTWAKVFNPLQHMRCQTRMLTLLSLSLHQQQQDDFHGTLNIKVSILGLLNLFCLQDQQVRLLTIPIRVRLYGTARYALQCALTNDTAT